MLELQLKKKTVQHFEEGLIKTQTLQYINNNKLYIIIGSKWKGRQQK